MVAFLKELWKKFWLLPILLVLALFGGLIILTQGSAVAPFIFLGISAFYHDSAAALVEDGRIVAAAQEERFSRKKHDARFPRAAIAACLAEGGVRLEQVDHVAFYDKPFLKFERLLETYLTFSPRGFRSFSMAMPVWLKEKLFQKTLLKHELQRLAQDFDADGRLLFSEHHQSHAASVPLPVSWTPEGDVTVWLPRRSSILGPRCDRVS